MVEASVEGGESARQLGEVADPTGLTIDGSFHVHFHPVGMSVKTAAFVSRRHVRQPVGRLEGKFPEDLHGSISSLSSGLSPLAADHMADIVGRPVCRAPRKVER